MRRSKWLSLKWSGGIAGAVRPERASLARLEPLEPRLLLSAEIVGAESFTSPGSLCIRAALRLFLLLVNLFLNNWHYPLSPSRVRGERGPTREDFLETPFHRLRRAICFAAGLFSTTSDSHRPFHHAPYVLLHFLCGHSGVAGANGVK